MKIARLFMKKEEPFQIDVNDPQPYGEEHLQDIDILYNECELSYKGYYRESGYFWFMFEAIKAGLTTGISFLSPKHNLFYHVIVTVDA